MTFMNEKRHRLIFVLGILLAVFFLWGIYGPSVANNVFFIGYIVIGFFNVVKYARKKDMWSMVLAVILLITATIALFKNLTV